MPTNCIPKAGGLPSVIVAGLAVALLLAAAPAQAGWLARAIGVGGVAHSVSKNMEETTNLFSRMTKSFIAGDDREVERLGDEIRNVPKNLVVNAFPALKAGSAVVNRVKSAKEKISRFVSGAKEKAVDARAALAVDRDSASEARVMASPLPSPPDRDTFVNRVAAPSAPASAGWSSVTGAGKPAGPPSGEAARVTAFAWGCFQHRVDVDDPDDYALWKARTERRLQTGASLDCAEVGDEGKKAGDGRTADAGSAAAEGKSGDADAVSAWLGTDRKQGSAQPGWDEVMGDGSSAQSSVSRTTGHSASGGNGEPSAYAAALQATSGAASGSDGGYLSALTALDEREAENQRLEEDERARQVALEDEEQERQAALEDEQLQPRSITQELDSPVDTVVSMGGTIGTINVILAWQDSADLDLAVECPSNRTISYQNTVTCGGTLDVDANAEVEMQSPVENIVFEESPESGVYQVQVNLFSQRDEQGKLHHPFTVTIIVDGQATVHNASVSTEGRLWTTSFNYRAD